MMDKLIKLIGLSFFIFAVYLITKEIRQIGVHHLISVIRQTPWYVIAGSFAFTVLDYLFLSTYDALGLKYLGKKLPAGTVIQTAAVSFAISNTTGQAYASGGAVRYLFYTRAGLSQTEILKLIAFETVTIFLGLGAAFLVGILLTPIVPVLSAYPHLKTLYVTAAVIAGMMILYCLFIILPRRSIKFKTIQISAPSFKLTCLQGLAGIFDAVLECAALFVLLRYHMDVHFVTVFIVYVVAVTIGISSQVPGGVGVFAGTFIYLFPHAAHEKGMMMASLILFRFIYYIVPFILAGGYLAVLRFISHTHRPPKNNQ